MYKVSDHGLVSRLYEGDVKAFDILYYRYHAALYRNILKLTKDAEIAQDILQDVFTTLWERRLELNADQSVSGWLFVLSFNKSISHLRQKLREEKIISHLTLPGEEPDNLDLFLQEERYQLLMKAIDSLSPQKKRVFTLCKLEGKTYEEAASELNISKYTIKEYLSAAVVSVRDYIRQHPDHWSNTALIIFINYWINL